MESKSFLNSTMSVLILMFFANASAKTITIDDDGPSDFNSIQAAIDDVNTIAGDEIVVSEGTYYENINFYGKNIILTGADPNDPNVIANTIIDGNENSSVVTFAGTEDPNCLLTGFTITNGVGTESGYLYYGGGIYGRGTLVTISKCLIIENSASSWDSYGGGIYDCDGLIVDCNISNNTSGLGGGGLAYCDGEINHCIAGNNICTSGSDPWGAGLYMCNGTIRDCQIIGNTCPASQANGGGLAACNGSIINCEITDNSVGGWAGGLGVCNGNIINCQVSGNVSGGAGAGFYNCDANIVNCIVYDNTNTGSWNEPGGGLYMCDGQIINCTIVANVAECKLMCLGVEGYGGGLYGCNGDISNCIIWGNIAEIEGDQLYACSDPNYSCIQDWTGGGTGNIIDDPCFANPNNENYYLKSQAGRWNPNTQNWSNDDVTSPCIDAGNPNSSIGKEPFPNGGRVNVGAYGGTGEASKSYFGRPVCNKPIAGDVDGDCRVDFKDLAIMGFHWLQDNNE